MRQRLNIIKKGVTMHANHYFHLLCSVTMRQQNFVVVDEIMVERSLVRGVIEV